MKKKILIVDDDWGTTEIVKTIVTREGYDTVVALGGRDAVEKVRSQLPHLILLDAMMPDMNGYDVCRSLRSSAEFKKIPIVMLTSLTQMADAERAFEAGANDFLGKPFDAARLVSKIKKFLPE